MKYPRLKTAVDAERKKQELTEKILNQKDNNFSKMSLLSYSVSDLKKLVEKPVKKSNV
ncbi:MAG: hypothetical protein KAT14_07485 [Candidatus Marinimicrobia bacterium]|nr:hypothetical protein [Candidatus Neomarinimicrobiota bacterium]